MAELLLELFSEEIPARMQGRAADDLKRLVCDGLKKAGLTFDTATAHATPRRLVLVVDGLADVQPDVSEEKKGPQVGAPDQAIAGFKGSLPEGAVIEEREIKGKMFHFAVVEKKGGPVADVLGEIIPTALGAISWPKSMRWNTGSLRWVRPLHSILAVFDGKPVNVDFGGVVCGNTTHGHRFMAPDAIEVSDYADYAKKMRAAKVMLDADERVSVIRDGADALAKAEGLSVKDDAGLLAEVAGLVEWPVVLMGTIDDAFMDVPSEVLIAAMRGHQKYFSCLDADGNMAPKFIFVSNMEAADGGAAIVAGNERVLRARLSDAKFFWDQDRKQTLASRTPKLKDIVFHAKLGSLDDKIDRVQALATDLAAYIEGADKDKVRSAARLAKADLVTDMVAELPELQGIMGRYYALNDGEDAAVADAIAEHYSPLGPNDACPSAPVSVAVAMADKIDTLVGFWAIDEKPTGSKDPFALRRAALGVIRLVLENGHRIALLDVFAKARLLYPPAILDRKIEKLSGDNVDKFVGDTFDLVGSADLLAFFADRLKVHLKGEGVRHDLIDAVFALGDDDLVRIVARVQALSRFVDSDDGANLLTAFRRAANILRIEEKKDGTSYSNEISTDLFVTSEETNIQKTLESVHATCSAALGAEDFEAAMAALATLRGPVDAFFDNVTVNVEDNGELRANRLKMLSKIRSVMGEIADFSDVEGD